jgi:outer membrane protein, heavy metal efflux system
LPKEESLRRHAVVSTVVCLPLVLGWASGAPAQEAAPESTSLSRRQAIDEALRHNPQVAAVEAQLDQARARIVEARAFPDPFFAATLEEEKNLLRPRTSTAKDIGLGLTVPFPGKLHLAGEAAAAEERAASLALEQLRDELVLQVNESYDELSVALRHGDDLRQARALADDLVAKAEARFRAGTVARLDVIKAKLDRSQAENDLIANQRAVLTAAAGLDRLLGRRLGLPVRPKDPLEVPATLPDLDSLVSLAEGSRPEMRSLQAQREGARDATKLARRYWQPDLSLVVSRNFTAGDPPAFSTAASFNLPVFFRQHEKGQLAEARFHEVELRADQRDLTAQVDLEVRTAYAAAATALRQVSYLRDELLPEAREAYRIASTSYGLGGSSSLEVLDAKRDLLDAESQYADALGAALDARAALERAIGTALPTATEGSKP